MLIVSLYVDDLIYVGNDNIMCEEFKQSMNEEFEMTDRGKMRYFLDVEVHQSLNEIRSCQKKYAKQVLERFNMWNCNPVKNPIIPGTKLTKGGEEVDATIYKQLVGGLMYLTVKRPDMMYVVCLISRFMAKPREEHMHIAKRVLRYLTDTLDLHLLYKRESGFDSKLKAYTDSDYAGDVDDRKNTSGYVFLLSGGAVCWSSRKQAIVTLSSTKAECVAATSCACHYVWMKAVLDQISFEQSVLKFFVTTRHS